jgi:hypothetical protein
MRPRGPTSASTLAAVPAGVVVGHWLAYLIAVPSAQRASFLSATGHAYWTAAIASAAVLGLIAAVRTVAGSFRHGLAMTEPVGTVDRFLHILPRLSVLQVAIFIVQEGLERLLAGAPIATVLHDDILVFGVVVQLAVAAVIALVLTLLGRVADAVGRAIAPARSSLRRDSDLPLHEAVLPASVLFRGAHGGRAPPPSLVTKA